MRENHRSEFGQRLEKALAYAEMTQTKLAEEVGLRQSTIAGLLKTGRGSSKTSKIAATLGVRVEWLADGAGSMVDEPSAIRFLSKRSGAGALLLQLAETLKGVDPLTRNAVGEFLSGLARNPDDAERIAKQVTALISSGKRRAA